MRKIKSYIVMILVIAMFFSVTGCTGDSEIVEEKVSENSNYNEQIEVNENEGETIKIKFGHQMQPESTEGKAYQHFADLVAENSGGSLEIVLYPGEQTGGSKEQIESTLIGTQDVVATGASLFSRFDSVFSTLTIPFLFTDNDSFQELMQGDIGEEQKQALLDNGLVLINPSRNMMRGPYRVLVSKKPIESIEDVSGLRFRSYENDIYMNAWKKLEANPIIIPWGDAYMALMQDTVQAVVSPMSQLLSMNFVEEAKYVTSINEYTSDAIWAMNKDKFETLSEEQQQIIFDAAEIAGDYMSKLDEETIKDEIKIMEEEHGAVFSDIDTLPFQEKLTEYYYELEQDGVLPEGMVEEALRK